MIFHRILWFQHEPFAVIYLHVFCTPCKCFQNCYTIFKFFSRFISSHIISPSHIFYKTFFYYYYFLKHVHIQYNCVILYTVQACPILSYIYVGLSLSYWNLKSMKFISLHSFLIVMHELSLTLLNTSSISGLVFTCGSVCSSYNRSIIVYDQLVEFTLIALLLLLAPLAALCFGLHFVLKASAKWINVPSTSIEIEPRGE